MKPFLEAIDERVLVCDGAMGTMLYAKGVFINRCFDALNLTDADRVAEVHKDYLRAGADVIETNTFGANRIKLRGFGLADRLREINREGARIARKAAAKTNKKKSVVSVAPEVDPEDQAAPPIPAGRKSLRVVN